MMEQTILTVTQLNEYVRMMIEANPQLSHFFVRGEISNFKNHYGSGHLYFTLKDDGGLVRAVMFRTYASRLKFMPADGMKVIVYAKASLYTKDGQFQIYAEELQPDGLGALYVAYEQLKAKLDAEGLFDVSRKKPIPKYPNTVGIITSATGAAVHDMIQIMARRYPVANIIIYPAAVQGAGAAAELIAGINWFERTKKADVVIIGRGGGSFEDLFAFNDEQLARTIAAADVPIISAVGHETDFTICDFVADLRAATPSAAAELAVPNINDLLGELRSLSVFLQKTMNTYLTNKREKLNAYAAKPCLQRMDAFIDVRKIGLDRISDRLNRTYEVKLHLQKNRLCADAAKMEALSPIAVLSRGYSFVTAANGAAVSNAAVLQTGDVIHVKMKDGAADASVTAVFDR